MKQDDIRTVGVIGLGRIGRPMAGHLAAAGYRLYGFDPEPEACSAAAEVGVTIAGSSRDVATKSQAILIVVGSQGQVEHAVFGPGGIVEGATAGTILMVASTLAPAYIKSLALRLEPHGLVVADVPVARGEAAARAGKLLVYAGGDHDALERCGPLLSCFAERVCRLGDVGAGQVAKAINNMLLWTCLCANVEGLDFGESLGVDREALREALLHGSGANWALETRADDRPALWAEKDMAIVLREAADAGLQMPVSATVMAAIKAFKAARNLPTPPLDD